MTANVLRLAAVWEFEKLLFIITTKVQMSTKGEAMTVSPNGQQTDVKCSLRPGDVIDVNTYGEHWDLRYGSVDRIEDDGVVWTMRYPAHDGCCWTYKAAFAKVRLAANCT